MQVQVASFGAALSANGDTPAKGQVSVASTTGIYPGMKGWLSNSTPLNQYVMVTRVISATVVAIRFLPEGLDDTKLQAGTVKRHNYGEDSCAAFTTVLTSRLDLPQQL